MRSAPETASQLKLGVHPHNQTAAHRLRECDGVNNTEPASCVLLCFDCTVDFCCQRRWYFAALPKPLMWISHRPSYMQPFGSTIAGCSSVCVLVCIFTLHSVLLLLLLLLRLITSRPAKPIQPQPTHQCTDVPPAPGLHLLSMRRAVL